MDISPTPEVNMKKEELVKKIENLLKTEVDLSFLLILKAEEVETLVACIRDRVDNLGKE
jgi:hypothetical protein